MIDCLFCRIVEKKIPAKIVLEDEETLAFLDIMPRAPGHTMVIPKAHASTIIDLPDSLLSPLFSMVKKTTTRLNERLAPDGFTIGINHGTVSGQEVAHLHVHILPRYKGDRGGSIQSVVHNVPMQLLEEIAKKLSI